METQQKRIVMGQAINLAHADFLASNPDGFDNDKFKAVVLDYYNLFLKLYEEVK